MRFTVRASFLSCVPLSGLLMSAPAIAQCHAEPIDQSTEVADLIVVQQRWYEGLYPDQPEFSDLLTPDEAEALRDRNYRLRHESLEQFVKIYADSLRAGWTRTWSKFRCPYTRTETVSCHTGQTCRNDWIRVETARGQIFDRGSLRVTSAVKDGRFLSETVYRFRAGMSGHGEDVARFSINARLTDREINRLVTLQLNGVRQELLNRSLPVDRPLEPVEEIVRKTERADTRPKVEAKPPPSPAAIAVQLIRDPKSTRSVILYGKNTGGSTGVYHFELCYLDRDNNQWKVKKTTRGMAGWIFAPGAEIARPLHDWNAADWRLLPLTQSCRNLGR